MEELASSDTGLAFLASLDYTGKLCHSGWQWHMIFCATVASATVERVGWAGLCTPWQLKFQIHFFQMIWSSATLENVSFVTLLHIEGACSDRVIRNFIQAFIWLLFATVYKGLLILLSPQWQMPLWPWGVTCHRYPEWHIFPVYCTSLYPIYIQSALTSLSSWGVVFQGHVLVC